MKEPKREKLPATRSSVTKKKVHGLLELYVMVSFFENDQPGEVFVKVGKAGSFVQGACDMLAMHVSYLLQLGVPADWILSRWTGHNLEPMAEVRDSESPTGFRSVSLYDTIAEAVREACSERGSKTGCDCWGEC